jgi:hypothetical protein
MWTTKEGMGFPKVFIFNSRNIDAIWSTNERAPPAMRLRRPGVPQNRCILGNAGAWYRCVMLKQINSFLSQGAVPLGRLCAEHPFRTYSIVVSLFVLAAVLVLQICSSMYKNSMQPAAVAPQTPVPNGAPEGHTQQLVEHPPQSGPKGTRRPASPDSNRTTTVTQSVDINGSGSVGVIGNNNKVTTGTSGDSGDHPSGK